MLGFDLALSGPTPVEGAGDMLGFDPALWPNPCGGVLQKDSQT